MASFRLFSKSRCVGNVVSSLRLGIFAKKKIIMYDYSVHG